MIINYDMSRTIKKKHKKLKKVKHLYTLTGLTLHQYYS